MNPYECIDWELTAREYGITKDTPHKSNKKVVYFCPACGDRSDIVYKNIARRKYAECHKCSSKLDVVKTQISERNIAMFRHRPELKEKFRKLGVERYGQLKDKMAAGVARIWQDPTFVTRKVKECRARNKDLWENRREEMLAKINAAFTPEYREEISLKSIKNWQNKNYREKTVLAGREKQPKVSSLQIILYSILDDLGIKYYREYPDRAADVETVVGPWCFDCAIPREGKPMLLIECQGEYWHNKKDAAQRDKSKATYIANNYPNEYELKQIWEHEFINKDKIIGLIKYWLGITQIEVVDFKFKDVEIKICEDSKLFLSKYHYLTNAGRGGIVYGAYLDDELIAICVFSPVGRQNIEIEGFEQKEVRELSRLCIHPKYQKRNFASWLISKCIKLLDPKYKVIISYCDTTFNHDGTIYKAANFTQDKEVLPDYWYITDDGWVMHKKTLYNHAIKMKMKENEYAEKMGYRKVWGDKKLRFVYKRI